MIRPFGIYLFAGFLPVTLLAQTENPLMENQTISWTGVSGITYEIWYSTDLKTFQDSGMTREGSGPLSFDVSDVFTTPLPDRAFFQLRWSTFVDSDNDLIDDAYEQLLVDANPSDGITTIQQFVPSDDFDNDGIKNYDEYRYGLNSQSDDSAQASSKLTYSYQLNRLLSVTSIEGSSVTFTYDKNQNITSVGQ